MRPQKPRHDRRMQDYYLIRDCLEGERQIKEQGELYTPKPDGMSSTNYQHYIDRGAFYGAPEMTLRALVGLALRKDPVIRLPSRLEPMRLRATNDKAPLQVLIEDMVREVTSMGRFGLMLDFPRVGTTAITTPHFVTWTAETIADWDTQYVDGQKELTRVVLVSDEDFDGADVFVELVLEDTIYKIRRFIREGQPERRVDIGEEIIPTIGGKALNYIPFLMVSHESLRPADVKPPLLDLCNLALSHFKNSCDREHAIFLSGSPTPWIAGSVPIDRVPTSIGSGTVWNLPEGTEVGMLEYTGAGVASMKELMQEKIDMMGTLGARMLSVNMNRNETIDTATQRTRSELSLLHSTVVMVEAALTRLLRLAAEWLAASPDEVSASFSRDFIEIAMEPKMVDAQLKLWQGGMISRATLYENLQRGEIARADRPWEDEKDMIDEEGGDLSAPVIRPVA